MCFATAALVAGAAGAATSAVGGVESGIAASNAASYQGQVAANNAIIANQNADYAIKAGQEQAASQSLKGAAQAGKVKATQAASGVDVNSGSNVNVQQSQREVSQLDTDTILNNAELKAYGYRTEATSDVAQEQLDQMTAEQAPIGADIGAAGNLLSNTSSLGLKWAQLGNTSGTGAVSGL